MTTPRYTSMILHEREEPQVHVVPNVDDPFAALPHASWILNVADPGRNKLINLANQIPDMYTQMGATQPHAEELQLRA